LNRKAFQIRLKYDSSWWLATRPVCHTVAKRFAVALSSVVKLMQACKNMGGVAPKKMGGYRIAILAIHEEMVKAFVAETPDAILAELGATLHKKKKGLNLTAGRPSSVMIRSTGPCASGIGKQGEAVGRLFDHRHNVARHDRIVGRDIVVNGLNVGLGRG
jgi:hypothetical protein